jgi:hypothetical protein
VDISVTRPGRPTLKLGPYPAPERYFDGSIDFPRPLGRATSVAVGPSQVFIGTADFLGASHEADVTSFSLTGEPRASIRARFPLTAITRQHIDAFIEDRLARASAPEREGLRQLYTQVEYPAHFPAYGRVLADPVGNVWIEEYPILGSPARVWRVYSGSGVLITTLTVPINLRLLEVGRDIVLGVFRHETDVDMVRVYRLVKPAG